MNFKPALCPSCSGSLQVPDNLNNVKCMYCGVDVIVKNATQLAGRVKEFTSATAIEKVTEWKPYDIAKEKTQTITIMIALGVCGLLLSFLLGVSIIVNVVATAILIGIVYLIRSSNLSKLIQANEDMQKTSKSAMFIGYKGQCPYCDTEITLKGSSLGYDCPACHKRIVVKESKFYSVDTPVSGLRSDS